VATTYHYTSGRSGFCCCRTAIVKQSPSRTTTTWPSGGSKNFERGRAEDNFSVPSSFIANAHNGLYAFYTEKGGLKKIWANRAAAAPQPPPWIHHWPDLSLGQFHRALKTQLFCWWLRRLVTLCFFAPRTYLLTYFHKLLLSGWHLIILETSVLGTANVG